MGRQVDQEIVASVWGRCPVERSRFGRLARSLAVDPSLPDLGNALSRRGVMRLLGGVGLGGALVVGTQPDPAQARCRKKCGACKRCKKGRCRPRPDDTPCGQGGRCLKGRCKSAPLCSAVEARCSVDNPASCCSGVCRPADLTCRRGNTGADCLTDQDCISGTCVGYRCQGYVDCTGAPLGTICHTDGGCAFDTCGSCWNEGSSTCCKIVAEAKICTSPSQCQQGQCT
jgi:hypothetical protein